MPIHSAHAHRIVTEGAARVPNFICIGSEKCGTTWLWDILAKHPEIGMPAVKEVRYFSFEYLRLAYDFPSATRFMKGDTANFVPFDYECARSELNVLFGGKDGYLRIFGRLRQKIVGDITPQYCVLPIEGISDLWHTNPHAKIIFLMRDPVERLLSGSRMKALEYYGAAEISAALMLARHPFQLQLTRYSTCLENYEKFYDPSRIFCGFLDDISTDPRRFIDAVCEFLEVAPHTFDEGLLRERVHVGPELALDPGLQVSVYDLIEAEYDALEKRFPVRVARWRQKYLDMKRKLVAQESAAVSGG